MTRPLYANRAGVTLIELTIVVVLIGVLSTIAMPRLDLDVFRMRSAVKEVGSTMLAAQRLALTRQHDVVVTFDAANRRLRVHEDTNNDGIVDAGEPVRFVRLADGVHFGRGGAPPYRGFAAAISMQGTQDGMPAITFRRAGNASEQAAFYLTSTRAAAAPGYERDTRVVHIARSTGRTSWFRRHGSDWRREF